MITVTTANICGNPIRPKPTVAGRMRLALDHRGVTFGQEVAAANRFRIGSGDYSTTWHGLAAAVGKDTFGGPHEVPVSLPGHTWEVLTHETTEVHPGLARVSPARYLTTVTARKSRGGLVVGFVNCHPVSKPRPGVDHAAWRIAHWAAYFDALAATVAELVDQGLSVVFGGDMNKVTVPAVHPRQTRLVSAGLDHLWCVPAAGRRVQVRRTQVIPRTILMDHPILRATFTLPADTR